MGGSDLSRRLLNRFYDWDAVDVGFDRFAFRFQWTPPHTVELWTANSGGKLKHRLRTLVCISNWFLLITPRTPFIIPTSFARCSPANQLLAVNGME